MFKFLLAAIMRIQSGIIAIATLAVLVVITTLALSSFTAEAHGTDGAIANLHAHQHHRREPTVSWDAASPVPTDYRVDWAKSGEDYTSWKVDDGHVYPAETATTTTITDLSHDTEYKIRMRARYYRGEHEGKSWGGPWAEATITVAGEPAETPTPEPVKEEPVQQPPRDDPDPPAGSIETLTALTTTPASSCSPGQPPQLQTPTPRTTTSTGPRAPRNTQPTRRKPATTIQPTPPIRWQASSSILTTRFASELATRTARTPPTRGTDPGRRQPSR